MATHGNVKPFNEQSDDWPTYYIERLQHYFIANEESKKRSSLLTVCGATTYKLIRSLISTRWEARHHVVRGHGEIQW